MTVSSNRKVFLALCVAGAFAPCAWAQQQPVEPATKGFSVGGHVTLGSWDVDDRDAHHPEIDTGHAGGIGGGMTIAYGVTEWLTIYVSADGRERDEHAFAHGDIGAQVFLRRAHRLRPHLDVAVTGRRAEFDAGTWTIDGRGAGWSFGGGVLYFLSSSFALDAKILRTAGDLDQYKDGGRQKGLGAFDVGSTRFTIGIRWYPGR